MMMHEKTFLFLILIFAFTLSSIFSVNKDVDTFLKGKFSEEVLSSLCKGLNHDEIIRKMLRPEGFHVRLTPSSVINGKKLISILCEEKEFFTSFLFCLKRYPKEMFNYIQENKDLVVEKYLPENLSQIIEYKYLHCALEFYKLAGIKISTPTIINFIKYYFDLNNRKIFSFLHEDKIELFSADPFSDFIKTIDFCFCQKFSKEEVESLRDFFDLTFQGLNSAIYKLEDARLKTFLKLTALHGFIRSDIDQSYIDYVKMDAKAYGTTPRLTPLYLSYGKADRLLFVETRDKNIFYSRLECSSLEDSDIIFKRITRQTRKKIIQTLFHEKGKKEKKAFPHPMLLDHAINASKPFINDTRFNNFYLDNNLQQLSLVFSLLLSRHTGILHGCYGFLDEYYKFKFDDNALDAALLNDAIFLNEELTRQLMTIDENYIPKEDPYLIGVFEEIMANSQETFNKILKIKIDETWENLPGQVKEIFSKKLIGIIMRICLLQSNTTYEALQKSIEKTINLTTQIFLISDEDVAASCKKLEYFLVKNKSTSFKKLLDMIDFGPKIETMLSNIQKHQNKITEKYIKTQKDAIALLHQEERDKALTRAIIGKKINDKLNLIKKLPNSKEFHDTYCTEKYKYQGFYTKELKNSIEKGEDFDPRASNLIRLQ